jgi:hypothetical protein
LLITEFVTAIVVAYAGAAVIPGQILDQANTEFAKRVDAVQSCFYRVDGEKGSYGSPHNYSLDPLCRYRMTKVTTDGCSTWKIIRT